jgi:two-component system LytT family sensor kinase
LAALLRSSIQDREALIPLHEEYELCVKYLGLQKLRFGEALQVDLQGQVGRSTSWLIPMYSLQQLAENAIKHNTLTTTSPLRLSIRFDPDSQTVTAMNNLQKRADADPGDGIGLKNLDERCLLLGLGPIEMNADADHFSVTIKLKRA